MAKTKRRIEITVEKHRLVMLNRRNQSVHAWCGTCDEQVQMVTPDEAAQLCRVSTRTIYRRIETGRLHFTETDRGFSLVCFQSLESEATATQADTVETASKPSSGFFRKSMRRILKRP